MTTSRSIISNQNGVHDNLERVVKKHMATIFQKPVAGHTRKAFDDVHQRVTEAGRPIVFDSCCGVGESSRFLARKFPEYTVVGVDKSLKRLTKEGYGDEPENLVLVRADLNDFYRLAHEHGWQLVRHYILYPNPWPKADHLKRRWHGAPIFPTMVALGGRIEVRSNWKIYLDEFQHALKLMGRGSDVEAYDTDAPITPFERKYKDSGQDLWRLVSSG